MADALATLLRGMQRYMIVIDRSKMDWGTGLSRASKIVLDESDSLDIISKGEIDAELRRAKHIYVILIDADGGTCRIDMTHRLVEIWEESASVHNRIAEFNGKLLEGARSRVFSFGFGVLLFAWSPVLALCGFTLWTISDPRIRHLVYATSNAPIPTNAYPAWLNDYGVAVLWFMWPLSVLVGIVIFGVVLSSGCLRVWPQSLTLRSGVRLFFSIRATLFTREIGIPVLVAIITSLVSVIITIILTHI
jgi:hypothetical protein